MGFRVSKVYTRTGDRGETGLADGSRIAKQHPRIEAMGDVDELNSQLGMLLAEMNEQGLSGLAEALQPVQHRLFDLGGELAIPGYVTLGEQDSSELENLIDDWNGELEPLRDFILPGGSRIIAQAHLARSLCRRAERRLLAVAADATQQINPAACIYLNRLSDLLFVAARLIGKRLGTPEVLWAPRRNTEPKS